MTPTAARGRLSSVAAGRACAYATVRRVTADGAFADAAFRAEADRAGVDSRDRAFAQHLAYGTVQRLATLDHVIDALASRPAGELDAPLRDALRMGIFELVYMGGVADHAAVAQTVELVKGDAPRAAGFANAVMRRGAREARDLVAALPEGTPDEAALRHSHPRWLSRMWWDWLGAEDAAALLARDNEPAESAVRANVLVTTPSELRRALADLRIRAIPAAGLPESLVLESPFDVHGSELFERGALMPQSRGSVLVSHVVDPQPGESVLDMCAAPGAKASHLAALMHGEGEVVAVERKPGRARALAANCRRLRADSVEVVEGDAAEPLAGRSFDRILLDAPCSNLGTLQARADARWRKSPEQIEALAVEQRALLESALRQVRPGGTVTYSTCTISASENERQIRAFLDHHAELVADDLGAAHPTLRSGHDGRFLQLLPHRDGTDGFFIARLRRVR